MYTQHRDQFQESDIIIYKEIQEYTLYTHLHILTICKDSDNQKEARVRTIERCFVFFCLSYI